MRPPATSQRSAIDTWRMSSGVFSRAAKRRLTSSVMTRGPKGSSGDRSSITLATSLLIETLRPIGRGAAAPGGGAAIARRGARCRCCPRRRAPPPPFAVKRLALGVERLLLAVMADLGFEAGQNRSERQPSIHGSPFRRKMPQSSGPVLRGLKNGGFLQEICRMTQKQDPYATRMIREIHSIVVDIEPMDCEVSS